MRTSEVLNKAADLIEERGWTQGRHISPDGFCVMGAIRTICGVPENEQMSTENVGWSAGLAVVSHVGTGVATWNDRADRTAAEVIEVLRATAVIEAARESDMAADIIALMASPA